MPAEYSKNPKNISRDKWEKEMSMKEIILRDAKMCAYAAGNVEHFKYLMKRLGYVFKKDAWMEVQAPGFRYYHKLAKLDEMFSEETLRHHVDMPWMAKPYFYSSDIRGLHRAKLSPYQKKFYAKSYRLRIVEQKCFVVGGAKYTEDLKRFHQLQDEYLLLVNNDIKSVAELVDFIGEQEERFMRLRTDSMRYTEKALTGNIALRQKHNIGNIRCGMWKCRKNWMSRSRRKERLRGSCSLLMAL